MAVGTVNKLMNYNNPQPKDDVACAAIPPKANATTSAGAPPGINNIPRRLHHEIRAPLNNGGNYTPEKVEMVMAACANGPP